MIINRHRVTTGTLPTSPITGETYQLVIISQVIPICIVSRSGCVRGWIWWTQFGRLTCATTPPPPPLTITRTDNVDKDRASAYNIIDSQRCKTVTINPNLTITLKCNLKPNPITLKYNPNHTRTLKSNPNRDSKVHHPDQPCTTSGVTSSSESCTRRLCPFLTLLHNRTCSPCKSTVRLLLPSPATTLPLHGSRTRQPTASLVPTFPGSLQSTVAGAA